MKKHTTIEAIAAVLLVIGGLNWGLIGLFRWDLFAAIFGDMTPLTRILYTVVGLAAVYRIAVGKVFTSSKSTK